MAITNMGNNHYIRRPGPNEIDIINKLNRYFTNEEFTIDPATPEAMILEVLNRVLPVIKTTARVTVMQMTQGAYEPEDLQALMDEMQSLRVVYKNNQEIVDKISTLELAIKELQEALNKIKSAMDQPLEEPEPEEPGEPGEPVPDEPENGGE
jgi:DNA-directed RNA polymerase beta' subunit